MPTRPLTVSAIALALAAAAAGELLAAEAGAFSPEIVAVPPGSFEYRTSGEYLADEFPIDAPMVRVTFSRPVEIMRYQVSAREYGRCVKDGACDAPWGSPPLVTGSGEAEFPVTGVSFTDAVDYAKWLTEQTGAKWRLPSDEEWAYAAGGRFVDDAVSAGENSADPSKRWLLRYKKYNSPEILLDPAVKPRGAFEVNEYGIADMSGNVWEWTHSCYRRVRVDKHGNRLGKPTRNCGVRIAEGRHRAYISFFVKDAKGGGCSVGAPPTHLGFRLIRDPARSVIDRLSNFWRALVSG